MTDRKGQCQHCDQPRFLVARGLCKRCHRDREVRERYDCDYTYLSDIDPEGPRPQPATSTEYAPGTEEKLRVLAERFARMDDLWHPEDAGFTSGNGRSIACKPRRRKLTDVMVLTIRQLAAQGQSNRAIAKLLGISSASVFDVRACGQVVAACERSYGMSDTLTPDAVLAMPAGEALDELVATRVLGWKPAKGPFGPAWKSPGKNPFIAGTVPDYSTSTDSDAMVLDWLLERWGALNIRYWQNGTVSVFRMEATVVDRNVHADTRPLALCRAALLETLRED